MLDLVENSLNQAFIEYRRLDGTMSLGARDRAFREFNTDPEAWPLPCGTVKTFMECLLFVFPLISLSLFDKVTVMLMLLKAGNLGLNMVAACHVILLDLWWNPTSQDQAVDQALGIGQTCPVTISQITIRDSKTQWKIGF